MAPRLLVLILALAAACQRPNQDECERLCWKFSELTFWAAFDEQAKDLSPEDKATLRAERQAEWDALRKEPRNPARDNCVTGCKRSGKKSQVECVEKSTSAAQATACLADD